MLGGQDAGKPERQIIEVGIQMLKFPSRKL